MYGLGEGLGTAVDSTLEIYDDPNASARGIQVYHRPQKYLVCAKSQYTSARFCIAVDDGIQGDSLQSD